MGCEQPTVNGRWWCSQDCMNITRRLERQAEIIDALQRYLKHAELPTARDAGRSGLPSASSVRRAFGNWNTARAAAGWAPTPVMPQRKTHLPRHDRRRVLHQLAHKPTTARMLAHQLDLDRREVVVWLSELREHGLATATGYVMTGRRGRPPTIWKLRSGQR